MDSERRGAQQRRKHHELVESRRDYDRLVASIRDQTQLYRRVIERYRPQVERRASRVRAASVVVHEWARKHGHDWPLDGAVRGVPDDWNVPALRDVLYPAIRHLPLSIPWGQPLDEETLEEFPRARARAIRVLPPHGAVELDDDEVVAALYALDRGLHVRAAVRVAVEAFDRNDGEPAAERLRKRLVRPGLGNPLGAYERWSRAIERAWSRRAYLDSRRVDELARLRKQHRLG